MILILWNSELQHALDYSENRSSGIALVAVGYSKNSGSGIAKY